MMLLNGEMTWFVQANHPDYWIRRYWLVKLTAEQIERQKMIHDDFVKYVGNHWNYDEKWNRVRDSVVTRGTSQTFYDKYPPGSGSVRVNLNGDENIIVGHFRWKGR